MNPYQQFDVLRRKELSFEEGIQILRKAKLDLQSVRTSADRRGQAAILANFILLVTNCLISACDLKTANDAYKRLVQMLYYKYLASGTRIEGPEKVVLSSLKTVINNELTRKGLTDYIPGVNILLGFAEDAMAVWQAQQELNSVTGEMDKQSLRIESQIASAINQLNNLRRKQAEMIDRIRIVERTA